MGMTRILGFFGLATLVTLTAGVGAWQTAGDSAALNADAMKGLALRGIGPALATGRIQDVQIDPKDPNVWYVASAFGGLWKTVNRGITFTPIFDDGASFTLCCVAIDPKDSNVIWLGTGENTSQRSAHFGDGIYKSTDAGRTWTRLAKGLPLGDTGRIALATDGRKSPATVFALMNARPAEAGFYRSDDGGANWARIGHVIQAGRAGGAGGDAG